MGASDKIVVRKILIEKTNQLIPISKEEFNALSATRESRKENIIKILREEKFFLRPTLKLYTVRFSEYKYNFSQYRLFLYWINKSGIVVSLSITKSKNDWFYILSNSAITKFETNFFKVKNVINLQTHIGKIIELSLKNK